MEDKEAFEKFKAFIKQNLLILALGFVGMILFSYGLISLFLTSRPLHDDMVFEAKDNISENISKDLVVDIQGSVVKPGVYRLPKDSRIQDALVVAGGLEVNADRDFISKNINLSTKLSDGAKIYIPGIGEDMKSITGGTTITSITGSLTSKQININTASEELLDSLPGIGPVTIQKIINSRPYTSIDELLEKKIVGSKVFGEIREKIRVY